MGFLEVDNRASTGEHRQYNTYTCHACGKQIVVQSKPLKGFNRQVVSLFNHITNKREEKLSHDYWCSYHSDRLCARCGEKSFRRGKCVSMIQIAEATATALNHKVDIWSQSGKLYIENLINTKVH
jgi:hypothetical protein